jgi:sugar phosphate permease
MRQALARRVFYGWVVVGVAFVALLVSAGVRAAPTVLINPLEDELGWTRAAISGAVSLGLLFYGATGPAVGWLLDRFSPTLVTVAGLALIAGSTVAGAAVQELWQLSLFWGLLSGIGTGVVAPVLGATVANRWFVERRGLALGLLGAAASAGQLIAVPTLMGLVVVVGWRQATVALAVVVAVIIIPVVLLMRDAPRQMGLRPLGQPEEAPVAVSPAALASPAPEPGLGAGDARPEGGGRVLRQAVATPAFWLLAGSFFICGASSNGIVGVHFLPHSIDHGIPEVTAASALALMGAMNFVGTIASGWLTDRHDPRKLLAIYYSFRGLSLLVLPFVTEWPGLALFAILFGLDYIATVPPTVALVADVFGRENVGTVFGWVFFAHQVGAALAAWLGGVARDQLGDYQAAFLVAGLVAGLGTVMALRVRRPAVMP